MEDLDKLKKQVEDLTAKNTELEKTNKDLTDKIKNNNEEIEKLQKDVKDVKDTKETKKEFLGGFLWE